MDGPEQRLAILPPELRAKLDALTDDLRSPEGAGGLLVAFSGGVDSALLLAAAVRGGGPVLAVTMTSPLQPSGELETAREVARQLGAEHEAVKVDPLADPALRANPPERCYLCKRRLFSGLIALARERGLAEVVDGSNVDDDLEHRPGKRALVELGVRSPLKDAGLGKAEIRCLAEALGLPNWRAPSMACLASRVPYGDALTAERLGRIDRGEALLRSAGFEQVRLRDHGAVARLEVAPSAIASLLDPDLRPRLVAGLKELGYAYVSVDLEGYRTGAMDEVGERVEP